MAVLYMPRNPERRRLYLIRHGDVSYFDHGGRPLDPRTVSLSEEGEVQVGALKEVLSDLLVDRAVSSDYPRAVQTLSQLLSQPPRRGEPELTDALREVRAGRLRDIPDDLYDQEVSNAYRWALSPSTGFLRGESWNAFSDRVLAWFHQFLAESDWQDAVIVSHDAVNRILMSWLLKGDHTLLPCLEQDPACLNIVDIDCRDDGTVLAAYLRLLNFTAYNPSKAGDRDTVMERIARAMRAMPPRAAN